MHQCNSTVDERFIIVNMHFYLLVCIGVPIGIFGTLTNILNIALCSKCEKVFASTQLLLISTAAMDSLYLISNYLCLTLLYGPPTTWTILQKFQKFAELSVLFYMSNCAELGRNWLVVLMAVERYMALRDPLRFRILWSPKVVGTIVGVLTICVLCLRLPSFIYFWVQEYNLKITCSLRWAILSQCLIDCLCASIIPNLTMGVLFILSSEKVRARTRTVEDAATQAEFEKKNDRILALLLGIVICFMICSLLIIPGCILKFYVYITHYTEHKLVFATNGLLTISAFASSLCSTLNFFIYIIHCQRYQRMVRRLFGIEQLFARIKMKTTQRKI